MNCALEQPQLPWKKMIGMRNVLVHNYWAIEQDEFWDAVQEHIYRRSSPNLSA